MIISSIAISIFRVNTSIIEIYYIILGRLTMLLAIGDQFLHRTIYCGLSAIVAERTYYASVCQEFVDATCEIASRAGAVAATNRL